MRYDPQQTFAALTKLLMDTCLYLDYKKTLRDEHEFIHAVTHLTDTFPVFKLEEWKVVMDRLKAGHYGSRYERLKLPELVEVFQSYEEERAERRERAWTEVKKTNPDALNDEGLRKLYEATAARLKAQREEREKAVKIRSVEVNERGRWDHIAYPNDQTQDPQEGDPHQETGPGVQ